MQIAAPLLVQEVSEGICIRTRLAWTGNNLLRVQSGYYNIVRGCVIPIATTLIFFPSGECGKGVETPRILFNTTNRLGDKWIQEIAMCCINFFTADWRIFPDKFYPLSISE